MTLSFVREALFLFKDNGSWTKVDESIITKLDLRNKLSVNIVR
jgi:hypothetical protein